MGGAPSHDPADDTFSATLKCHDQNGEVYGVTLLGTGSPSHRADDALLTRIETGADSMPAPV
ncbi:hypothetical protein [Methanosphaerula subterraneus]|uniref:hypothetical protein n=1 Tax=Methanosphaerula subterraneus TaxID=3350244 RepID=UPI003F84AFD1